MHSQQMTESTAPGVRVGGDPDQRASPQHDDLEEDLDALVDLETQRIMDEADLLEFSEDDEDEEDVEEEEDEVGDDGNDDEDEDDEEEYRSEDDQDYEGSPSREDRNGREVSASPDAIVLHRGQGAGTGVGSGYQEDLVNQADPLDGLGSFSPIQGMSLPQNLGDEGAICQRTRNRMPLNHVSLDELDALLGREDEGLFDEEGEQYAQFLRVLRGEEDLRELLDDDDEDEDFTLDWDELMGANPFGEDEGGPPPPPRRSKRQQNYAYVYQNKNERPGHKERPVESTARVQTRQLKPLLPLGGAAQPAQGGPGWGDQHTKRLRALIAQHAQLLATTFAMAAATPGHTQSAGVAGQMLHALQSVPQWLWSPVLEGMTSAVTRASSLQEAVAKLAELPVAFNSALLPQAGYVPMLEGWQSEEDALLARGVRRFGKQHLKIHQYFLPTRPGADIIARIKHLTRPAAPPNPVKAAHQRNVGPLLPDEIKTIEEQLRFMGKQPKRWELIISHHLPYRTVGHLSKLWAAHQAVLQQTAPGMLHWTLVLGSAAPAAPVTGSAGRPAQLALPCLPPPQLAVQATGRPGNLPHAQPAQNGPPPWPAVHLIQATTPSLQSEAYNQLALPAMESTSMLQHSLPAVLATQAMQPHSSTGYTDLLLSSVLFQGSYANGGPAPTAPGQPGQLSAHLMPAPQAASAMAGHQNASDGSEVLAASGSGLHSATTQQRQSSSLGSGRPGSGGLRVSAAPHTSAFIPYQRPTALESSNGAGAPLAVSGALLHQDRSQRHRPKPMVHVTSPQDVLRNSPLSEHLPGSLPASPHGVSARVRPRKRKQPVPSHGARSQPLLEPTLDDALLSAANARIRSGRPGRRPVRGARAHGLGSDSAGQSPETPIGQTDASGPNQALLAVSARLAAETRSPKAPKIWSAAGSSPDPAVQTAAPASQEAPLSPPFWHLPPASPPRHAHALASQPQLAPLQKVGNGGQASAVTTASQSGAKAGKSSCEGAVNARQSTAVGRVEPPLCRKWLDFSGAADFSVPQSLQPGISAGSLTQTNAKTSTEQGIKPTGEAPLPERDGVGQQLMDGAPGVQERPGLSGTAAQAAQTGHPAHAGQVCQGKGGDAELMIGGVLTRWTKAEDIAILNAALKANGTLSMDASARIMRLPRDQKSFPLPRTAEHIYGRLDWLLIKLLGVGKRKRP